MNALLFLFTFTYLTLVALGQRIAIGAPAEWSTVKPGSNITVEVDRPRSPLRSASGRAAATATQRTAPVPRST
ncbi:hypothetical protein ONZ51_g12949 [Trametes cubensis]|uniref:Uncharacterized protein n=1 Tax=Trametes cubensis TaxID=1111947 RepID=A0AAD7X486_9APHY|nr:hypothetical protein ONZ51_g12949 [Trametes cubensis]